MQQPPVRAGTLDVRQQRPGDVADQSGCLVELSAPAGDGGADHGCSAFRSGSRSLPSCQARFRPARTAAQRQRSARLSAVQARTLPSSERLSGSSASCVRMVVRAELHVMSRDPQCDPFELRGGQPSWRAAAQIVCSRLCGCCGRASSRQVRPTPALRTDGARSGRLLPSVAGQQPLRGTSQLHGRSGS